MPIGRASRCSACLWHCASIKFTRHSPGRGIVAQVVKARPFASATVADMTSVQQLSVVAVHAAAVKLPAAR